MFHVHVHIMSCTKFETELIGLILLLDLFFTRSDFSSDLSGMDSDFYLSTKIRFVFPKSFLENLRSEVRWGKLLWSFNLNPAFGLPENFQPFAME